MTELTSLQTTALLSGEVETVTVVVPLLGMDKIAGNIPKGYEYSHTEGSLVVFVGYDEQEQCEAEWYTNLQHPVGSRVELRTPYESNDQFSPFGELMGGAVVVSNEVKRVHSIPLPTYECVFPEFICEKHKCIANTLIQLEKLVEANYGPGSWEANLWCEVVTRKLDWK